MNNENKLIPKLRFPEFKNEEEWTENMLGNVCKITNGKSNAQDHVENGKYPLFDRSEVIKASNNFLFDCEAVIIPGEGMKFIPKYYKGKFDLHQRAYALKDFSVNGLFVYYSMVSRSNLLVLKAVKSTVLSLRLPILQNFQIVIPNIPQEQQKIAACLSSLDEVITGESRKLELLKEHKKGLLQNLFPQEGEAVPKLRFPEFKNSGAWEEKTIEQVAKVTTGNKDTQNKVENGDYPFYVRSQNVERINTYSYDGEAILTSGDGVGVGKNFHYINGKFDFHQRVYCIYKFEKEIDGKFIYMYFSQHFNERVMRMSAKNSVDSVRRTMITKMPILIPSKSEQQKIANTLSSIDDLINAQSQKIETLKLHKKGLLQGLFPLVNEESNG